jgi:amino acid transporter
MSTSAGDLGSKAAGPRRQLTLFDSTCIIVGIIIGVGIYETSPQIAQCVPGPAWLGAVWMLGGILSLVGALCYAELATAYPQEGGDYVYLTRAFGRPLGFLFAWAQLWVVRPGSIGAAAYVFARYAKRLWPIGEPPFDLMTYALASIVVLTVINVLGVRAGKTMQNLLTTVKVLGLGAIVVLGLVLARPGVSLAAVTEVKEGGIRLAMIMILFTYGGWNEMAYVGAEVRDPRRNILRALVLGTVAVTVIYLLVNVAFVHALGFEGTRKSEAVAADVLELGLADWGARGISVLVCISALASINGQIFTGARIYYAMGTDHRLYGRLGRWNPTLGTPVCSLVLQAAVTAALVAGFGFTESGFGSMVKFTTPAFWLFFLLAGVSLFVLRRREPDVPRPYRVPWYPFIPIAFCLSSLFMLYSSLSYAIENRTYEAAWSLAILAVGVVLACFVGKARPDGIG